MMFEIHHATILIQKKTFLPCSRMHSYVSMLCVVVIQRIFMVPFNRTSIYEKLVIIAYAIHELKIILKVFTDFS